TYIDRNVTNGETYYYAVVAYDRGLVARGADGSVQVDPSGVRGLSPSLTTAVVKNDVAGNVVADVNTAVATPRAPAAGYVPPDVEAFARQTTGTGTVDVQIVVPGLVEQAVAYELAFENAAPWGDSAAVRYTLTNETTGAVVAEGDVGAGRTEIPPLEGFVVDLDMPGQVA